MKKWCFLSLCLLCTILTSAQTTPSDSSQRINVYLLGGVNFSDYLLPKSLAKPLTPMKNDAAYKMKVGAQVGLFVDIKINDHWSFEPGLLYSYQRVQSYLADVYNQGDTTISKEATEWYNTHYAKLPLVVNYHFSSASNHFTLGAGVYLSCALACKAKLDESVNSTGYQYTQYANFDPYIKENRSLYRQILKDDYVQELPYHFSDNIYNRFDFGVSLKAGYQISKFYLGIQADLGLLNMGNKKYFGDDFMQRNLCLQAMVGYRIN